MCTHVIIIILSASSCFCYAGYELFQGFDVTGTDVFSDSTTELLLDTIPNNESDASQMTIASDKTTVTQLRATENSTTTEGSTLILTTKSKSDMSTDSPNIFNGLIEATSVLPTRFVCPEDEGPSNIGLYEIPTQRDLVFFTRNILLDMFNSYNKEAFYLLKDIRAATRATSSTEKKCEGNRTAYRQCVKLVSNKYQQITKDLVKALDQQKQEIIDLTKGKICNLSEMERDPVQMLKLLAQEKVSLEFALPGFLRLLNVCSLNCIQSALANSYYKIKPMRHMTDQDLVIQHFLTRKNYIDLIMDSEHKSLRNSN